VLLKAVSERVVVVQLLNNLRIIVEVLMSQIRHLGSHLRLGVVRLSSRLRRGVEGLRRWVLLRLLQGLNGLFGKHSFVLAIHLGGNYLLSLLMALEFSSPSVEDIGVELVLVLVGRSEERLVILA